MSAFQTSFQRFEYKYWVTDAQAEEFLRGTLGFLRRDGDAPRGQRNTSLYLDSPDLDFYSAHTESSPDRLKLRVRAYGDPPRAPAFFEIKRKVKAVSVKRRAAVPIEAVEELLGAGTGPMPILSTEEEERTLSHFLYLKAIYNAEPQLLITCDREAYSACDRDEGVRITLDRDVRYQRATGPSLRGAPSAWIQVQSDHAAPGASTLIEVKFQGVAAWWLEEIVQRVGMVSSAFSKYIAAMAAESNGPALEEALDRVPASGISSCLEDR